MPNAFESATVYAFVPGEKKNFGWILPDAGLPRIFFHISNFVGPDAERVPQKGDRVIFTRGKTGAKGPRVSEVQFDPFISLSGICHEKLGTTLQDGSRYIGGFAPTNTPDLSSGLRWQGSREMCHSLKLHRDDAPRFVERVLKWERAKENAKTVLIYMSGTEYFFSNVYNNESVPDEFEPITKRLPIKIPPQQYLADGIIASPAQLLQHLGYVVVGVGLRKHIPNPDPKWEPEYSGYYKKPE